MRVPQVSERVKELPAQALRGVFAGIGQLLLITDKLMNKTPPGRQVPQARGPERSETVADTAAPAAETAKAVPTEKEPTEKGPTEKGPTEKAPTEKAPTEKAPEARDLDKTGNVRLLEGAEAGAGGAAEEADVPLPNYDELSVASLRARLRNLDAAQVKQMAEYERAHAARADVITMFERRIAKLEAGG
jgi:hypothetical protein